VRYEFALGDIRKKEDLRPTSKGMCSVFDLVDITSVLLSSKMKKEIVEANIERLVDF